ncbi:MAG: hypothetical protein LBV54_01905, partial [Puniceicoccales bacterium]|nr:hypothetical protein [Puniceicoccales bacterium]
ATRLEKEFPGISVGIVNARFAKPLDTALLEQHAAQAKLIVSLEDHVLAGGFGSGVLEVLQEQPLLPGIVRIGWPDEFVEHGTSPEELRAAHGLSPDGIFERVAKKWREIS